MKENIIQDILISLTCKGILSTCPVYCSQYQSLNWAVWWECHVAVTAGDTWHEMRHGCVTEMSGWRVRLVCADWLGTRPCKHKQWGRCSLAPSPGRHHWADNTILQMLFCHSQCRSRQTKQNTRHTQGSMNARVRPQPTLDFFFIFSFDLNQSVEQNVNKFDACNIYMFKARSKSCDLLIHTHTQGNCLL